MFDWMIQPDRWQQGIGFAITLLQTRNPDLAQQVKTDLETMVMQRTVQYG